MTRLQCRLLCGRTVPGDGIFQIPLLLFLGKTAEGFFAAIADEERTGNDVHNLIGIFVPDGAVQGQAIDFPFRIADNTDLLIKGVTGFNIAAYGLLHGVQRSADFRDPCRLSGFHQNHLDGRTPDGVGGKLRLKRNFLESKAVTEIESRRNTGGILHLHNIRDGEAVSPEALRPARIKEGKYILQIPAFHIAGVDLIVGGTVRLRRMQNPTSGVQTQEFKLLRVPVCVDLINIDFSNGKKSSFRFNPILILS